MVRDMEGTGLQSQVALPHPLHSPALPSPFPSLPSPQLACLSLVSLSSAPGPWPFSSP